MMVQGSKWELYIPANLAYGPNTGGHKKLEPREALIVRLHIVEIEGDLVKARCEYETRLYCDDSENEVLDKWWEKSVKDIEKQIKLLKKKASYSLKEDDRKRMNKQ